MANQWFKFYGGDFLSDPKIENLTPAERSCWITLLCLASMGNNDGEIEFLTIDGLLKKSGIVWDPYDTDDWDYAKGVLVKLERLKMIDLEENGTIKIKNWEARQETNLTNAERQAKYRDNKNSNKSVTPVTTKVTLEENRIEEKRRDNTNAVVQSTPSNEVSETIDLFKEVNPSYKKWFGNKTQRSAIQRMLDIHTFEKVKKVIRLLPKTNTMEYMPVITTPIQLEDKWAQLATALQKVKNNQPIIL